MPAGVRVWLATGHSDIRQGPPGLALLVQESSRPISTAVICWSPRRWLAALQRCELDRAGQYLAAKDMDGLIYVPRM